MPSRARRIAIGLSVALFLTAWVLTIEGHFVGRHDRLDNRRAEDVAGSHDASKTDVALTAPDGVTLRGWLFTPHKGNRRAVILVHGGVGDRQSMLPRAKWLLGAGYTCLLIDQRGCGRSGGAVSFGLHEPPDTAAWVAWLRRQSHAISVYGHGSSRGGTTLLQSLALRPQLDGIVLESTGAGNIGHPYQFVGDRLGISEPAARIFSWPFIEPSFFWVRLRHGFDLRTAPYGIDAVRGSDVPVLLIQGTEDRVTPPIGAERIRAANPQHVEVWAIPGADHNLFGSRESVIMRRILAWFDTHAPGG